MNWPARTRYYKRTAFVFATSVVNLGASRVLWARSACYYAFLRPAYTKIVECRRIHRDHYPATISRVTGRLGDNQQWIPTTSVTTKTRREKWIAIINHPSSRPARGHHSV